MRTSVLCFVRLMGFVSLACGVVWGQADLYYQADFPAEEFQGRWAKVLDRIGPDAFALVQGYPKVPGFMLPRQSNEFYYLTGVETPGSYVLLDGKTRKAVLFLPPRDERLERSEGRVLSASDAEFARAKTGAAEVLSTEALTAGYLQKWKGKAAYTPFAPAEGYAQSRGEARAANESITRDPWDGRPSREENLRKLLRERIPDVEVKDLTPILDEMRVVKSPREIALVRRASQIGGLAILEAMHSTKPGLFEYELEAAARYVYLVNGARLDAYRSIIAAGTANIWNPHYYRNSSELKSGDLLLLDYAPDYRYYVSDVTRMWPINGKFAPWQRELLGFVLLYRNEIMKRIRPGVKADDIQAQARMALEPVVARTKWSKPVYEQAARKLIETGGGVFSHPVGMTVHDVGNYKTGVLQPGHVFSIDPQLRVPEENLYIRYEDVGVVTATGWENFTDFLPSELNEIEKHVRGEGMVQKFPPRAGMPGK